MSNLKDDFSSIGNETVSEATEAVRGLPWYVKIGIPAVLLIGVGGGIWGWVNGMFEANTRTLDSAQMQIVNAEAERVAKGYQERSSDGTVYQGSLLSCANSDSDPKGSAGYMRVTCTVRIPQAKDSTVDGKPFRAITMTNQSMDCGIPAKGTSGCKLKSTN